MMDDPNTTRLRKTLPAVELGAAQPAAGSNADWRQIMWGIQGAGLAVCTVLSFYPRLSHVQEYIFFVLLTLALVTLAVSGEGVLLRTPLDLPLGLYVGWVLLSVAFATDPAYSLTEWRKLVSHILVMYWTMAVLRAQPDERVVWGVQAAVVIGTVFVSCYALLDFIERGGVWTHREIRAGAPSSDYNWLSTYIVIVLPIVIAVGFLSKRWWQWVAAAVVCVLALVAEYVSFTRAGWTGIMAEGLSVGLFFKNRKMILGIAGGYVLFGAGLFMATQQGYLSDVIHTETLNARLAMWKLATKEIEAHPLVGVGYGNDTFRMRFAGDLEAVPGGVHNMFLMVAMGSGLPALGFLLWTFGRVIRLCLMPSEKGEKCIFMIGTATMVVGFSVRNIFDYMFVGSLANLFWIVVAMALCQRSSAGHSEILMRPVRRA